MALSWLNLFGLQLSCTSPQTCSGLPITQLRKNWNKWIIGQHTLWAQFHPRGDVVEVSPSFGELAMVCCKAPLPAPSLPPLNTMLCSASKHVPCALSACSPDGTDPVLGSARTIGSLHPTRAMNNSRHLETCTTPDYSLRSERANLNARRFILTRPGSVELHSVRPHSTANSTPTADSSASGCCRAVRTIPQHCTMMDHGMVL